jgi:hypothetical protein
MAIKDHVQASIYIRNDLYLKARSLNFNMTEFVNRCLEMVLADENSDIPNLLSEERALRARLAEIQTKKQSVQNAPPQVQENRIKAEADFKAQTAKAQEQQEAAKLFKSDPKAYAKKYLGATDEELEAVE